MIFKHPLVLAVIPVVIVWFVWLRTKKGEPAFLFPTDEAIRAFRPSVRAWVAGKLPYLRLAALVLMIAALARPQVRDETMRQREGITVMLTIDCSSTMLAEDLQLGEYGLLPTFEDPANAKEKRLNRVDAAKLVARSFVKAQPHNLIGVTAFGAYAYVVCPPTFDQQWILSSIDRIKVGMIEDGTAIGSGILASADSLSKEKTKSRVIVLLTDGNNNYGKVPPLVAARAAKALGIKIYTVGIVTKGRAPFPVKDARGRITYEYYAVTIDEDSLRGIAETTGGRYYRVTSLKALEESYADIDKLEKALLAARERENNRDLFGVFLMWALGILLAEIFLGNTYLRRIP